MSGRTKNGLVSAIMLAAAACGTGALVAPASAGVSWGISVSSGWGSSRGHCGPGWGGWSGWHGGWHGSPRHWNSCSSGVVVVHRPWRACPPPVVVAPCPPPVVVAPCPPPRWHQPRTSFYVGVSSVSRGQHSNSYSGGYEVADRGRDDGSDYFDNQPAIRGTTPEFERSWREEPAVADIGTARNDRFSDRRGFSDRQSRARVEVPVATSVTPAPAIPPTPAPTRWAAPDRSVLAQSGADPLQRGGSMAAQTRNGPEARVVPAGLSPRERRVVAANPAMPGLPQAKPAPATFLERQPGGVSIGTARPAGAGGEAEQPRKRDRRVIALNEPRGN
jgi:hypothetical protein